MEKIEFGKTPKDRKKGLRLGEVADAYYAFLLKKGNTNWLGKIKDRLRDEAKGYPKIKEIHEWVETGENLKDLIVALPCELEEKIKKKPWQNLKESEDIEGKPVDLLPILKKIWGYADFRKSESVYQFYKEHLDVPVCPYCNRNYTTTLFKAKDGKLLYHFDHFFSQSKYPYLSLSFFNLIPSCGICNSHLRGSEDFCLAKNCHPFEHSFHDALKFFIVPPQAASKYQLELAPQPTATNEALIRANGNAKTFEIREVYKCHYDEIPRFQTLRQLYPKEYMQSLAKNNPKLFPCGIEDVKRTLLGANFVPGEISKRPLGKLIHDLYQQLWD